MAPDGTVYVAEAAAKRIGVFAADGTPRGRIGPTFYDPYAVAVAGASLWVVDTSVADTVRRISRVRRARFGAAPSTLMLPPWTEPVIERAEVVALLFNVSDIASSLAPIARPLGRTMAKKKLTEAERAEFKAERERMLVNAARTRELAERAQAKLDAKSSQQ